VKHNTAKLWLTPRSAVSVSKTCQLKTWCKGDKSNIENSTDHFLEDIKQNALATIACQELFMSVSNK